MVRRFGVWWKDSWSANSFGAVVTMVAVMACWTGMLVALGALMLFRPDFNTTMVFLGSVIGEVMLLKECYYLIRHGLTQMFPWQLWLILVFCGVWLGMTGVLVFLLRISA